MCLMFGFLPQHTPARLTVSSVLEVLVFNISSQVKLFFLAEFTVVPCV